MGIPGGCRLCCTTALVEAREIDWRHDSRWRNRLFRHFLSGQERYDTYSGRVVLRRFKGSMEEWQAMGVMNYEMESLRC